ncbi:MAG: hypothetical protein N2Z76_05410 [Treponemataceae bacterium]|nr:hypothetical protein [Treponemataceae bacterium]
MTLSVRNRLIFLGVLFIVICYLFIGFLLPDILKGTVLAMQKASSRPTSGIASLGTRLFKMNIYSSLVSSFSLSLISVVSVVLVYFFFEKTHVPEVLCTVLFLFSLSLELSRCLVPLVIDQNFSYSYIALATRIVLAGRLGGSVFLFLAGLYAAGLNFPRYSNVIFLTLAVIMPIISTIPINSSLWDTTLMGFSKYGDYFMVIELVLVFLTILSFIIAVTNRGSHLFIKAAIAVVLLYLGRAFCVFSDNWITLLVGLPLLVSGLYMLLTTYHTYYRWL